MILYQKPCWNRNIRRMHNNAYTGDMKKLFVAIAFMWLWSPSLLVCIFTSIAVNIIVVFINVFEGLISGCSSADRTHCQRNCERNPMYILPTDLREAHNSSSTKKTFNHVINIRVYPANYLVNLQKYFIYYNKNYSRSQNAIVYKITYRV